VDRLQRPRKWIRISLRSAVPAWLVLGVLVSTGLLGLHHALLAGVLAALLAGMVAWRPARLRDALRRRMDALASGTTDPGRPIGSDSLNRAFDRLVRVWRARIERLAAETSEKPRIMDAMPDPLLLIDSERRVTRANRAARELAGIDLTGYDLAVGLRNPQLLEAVDRVLAGGSGESIEQVFPVPVERVFAIRIEPLGEDLPDAAVAVFHDLTALEQMEKMRTDFVANVSHELKPPLASLRGYIETLQGPAKDDDEARERFLAVMEEQAQRMARLIDDLLSLSRIELEEHARPSESVGLDDILNSVARGLAPQAEKRNIDLRIDVPDELPRVRGDKDRLAEVFQNLIENGVKYGREGGGITIEAGQQQDGTIAVSVKDDGPGIAPEHIPRLTERFYRVDPDRSRETGGTGLGLAIVKHIVNRHRGRLIVQSEVGRGSRFTVILPAYETVDSRGAPRPAGAPG